MASWIVETNGDALNDLVKSEESKCANERVESIDRRLEVGSRLCLKSFPVVHALQDRPLCVRRYPGARNTIYIARAIRCSSSPGGLSQDDQDFFYKRSKPEMCPKAVKKRMSWGRVSWTLILSYLSALQKVGDRHVGGTCRRKNRARRCLLPSGLAGG